MTDTLLELEPSGFVSGEIGFPAILRCLQESGHQDLIWKLAMREDTFSFYHFVQTGETAPGEYWEDNPRSHNHDWTDDPATAFNVYRSSNGGKTFRKDKLEAGQPDHRFRGQRAVRSRASTASLRCSAARRAGVRSRFRSGAELPGDYGLDFRWASDKAARHAHRLGAAPAPTQATTLSSLKPISPTPDFTRDLGWNIEQGSMAFRGG